MNTQPAEKQAVYADPMTIEVVDLFATIQGEGPFAGKPAIFIRLAGCSLACPHCDTNYTTNRRFMSFHEIKDAVYSLMGFGYDETLVNKNDFKKYLIVITGGEPFRHPNVLILATYLSYIINLRDYDCNINVQIETNGIGMPLIPNIDSLECDWATFMHGPHTKPSEGLCSYFSQQADWLHVVCSPKTTKITAEIRLLIGYWKYVVAAENVNEETGLPNSVLGYHIQPYEPADLKRRVDKIYIQPEWNENKFIYGDNLAAAIKSCMKHGYKLSIQQHKLIGLP